MIKTSRILSIILTLIIASASWTGAKAQYWEAKGGRPAIVGNFYYLLFDSESGTNTAILTDKEYAGTAAGSNSYSGTVIIPESFQTENANKELATYTVIGIDDYAFYGSTGLIKVDIPKTVVSIGKMAFDGCTSLQKITVHPENQSFYVHDDVLYNFARTELIVSAKTKTGKFIVPEDVKKINEFAFHDCENITEIVLPNGLKEIGKAAFWGCTNMTSINIPTSLTTLGSDAFRDDSSLSSSITIPATVSIIGSNAFRDCRKISSVTIADGVTEIGEYAFNECSKITSIELPASINLLGSSSFAETGLTSISIPYSITNIPSSAFANCKLTSITLPKNLQTIDAEAFADNGTNIEKVEIPESVISIGNNAFNGTNVKNFYINNIPSKIDLNANSPFKATGTSIHVFTLMKNIFENATNWSNYKGHFVDDIEITHVESITLDNTNMTVLTGATGKLNATINPEDARIKDVVYTSSDPNLILIDSATGVFSAGANEGDATITCTANDGTDVFAKCKITVKKSFVPATSVTLNKTNASMEVGNSLKLTATITPTNATYKNIIWVSSDENVAEVSDGTVTAVGPGNATITAISGDGNARAKCTVTVKLTLTDGEAITGLDTYKGQEIWVNYTRSFTADKPSTVCLPFAYTKKPGDGSFYEFTGIEKVGSEYIATMTEPGTSTLTANTPYLYKAATTGDADFSGTYAIPASIEAGTTISGDWTFKGTYSTIEWTDAPAKPTYGFSAQAANDGITQGQFVKVGSYVRIKPMRAYLQYNGSDSQFINARSLTRAAATTSDDTLPETIGVRLISANGEVTAIGTLYTRTGEVSFDSEAWYTLDGKRLNAKPNTKGIYVNNGKKVVIK